MANKYRLGFRITLFLALLAGIMLRIQGAWWFRHTYNPDYGIVNLMVRHILDGNTWPVFFYGQAYMGSLEPLTSALFAKLTGGPNGFAICLGTAVYGIALLWAVYSWGRDAGGRIAGLAALLFCIIGPTGYIHYMASPRGGYGILLLATTLVLSLGARLLSREFTPTPAKHYHYLTLGLIAGLGFWSHFLVAPAIMAVAIAFLVILRTSAFKARILFATATGFVVGSLPVWIWNLLNHGETFNMSHSNCAGISVFHGLHLLLHPRLFALLDISSAPKLVAPLLITILALAGLATLIVALRPPSITATTRSRITIAIALLYLPIFAILFATSDYAIIRSPRYLLPLVPAIALFIGCGTSLIYRRHPILAWIPLALIIPWQATHLPSFKQRLKWCETRIVNSKGLDIFLQQQNIHTLYTSYDHFSLNYLSGEKFIFTDPRQERYLPYAQKAELAPSIAIYENFGGINEHLSATQGNSPFTNQGFGRINFNFTPPTNQLIELPPNQWQSVTFGGNPIGNEFCDRQEETSIQTSSPNTLEITFKKPTQLAGINIYNNNKHFPNSWFVKGQFTANGPFLEITKKMPTSPLFWSGPRIYSTGLRYRMHCRFTAAPLHAVQIIFNHSSNPNQPNRAPYHITELQLLSPAREPFLSPESPTTLIDTLNSNHITRLYCDRFLANKIHIDSKNQIWTPLEPKVFGVPQNKEFILAKGTAILMPLSGAPSLRDCLTARKIKFTESPLPPHGILFLQSNKSTPKLERTGIYLNGNYAYLQDPHTWANFLFYNAQKAPNSTITDYESILIDCPDFLPAWLEIAQRCKSTNNQQKLREAESKISILRSPLNQPTAKFTGGIKLIGYQLTPANPAPGEMITADFYWCIPSPPRTQLMVFTHYKQGDYLFQDDHPLDTSKILLHNNNTMHIQRKIQIPTDAPLGPYKLKIGLYRPTPPFSRIKAKTSLPNRHNSVTLPITLHVAPATPKN